ncbi:MAG: alpha/beta hydrolase, partial [Clostridiales bacterium]|nr:alpha/beta hydrolase [Clostridiales bacterium]
MMVFTVAASAVPFPTEKPFENSEYFTTCDYKIHYRVFEAEGQQKGRILFLHGFLVSTYSWENMAAEMTGAGYTCVLADLPNFGYSTRENAATVVIPREALMVDLMQSMAPLESWLVAGHSMGGGVAMNIAIEHAEIAGLLLFCPAPNAEVAANMKPLITSKLMGTFYTAFFKLASYPKLLARLVVGFLAVDLKFGLSYDVAQLTDPLQIDGSGPGITYMSINTRATDMSASANLAMPVLLIEAEKDNALPKEMIDETIAALPQATIYIVQGGG